ncbi:rab11 family-interacting protein 5 isoform X3 [Symphalangus syndactylus]|uniref:rab11 family-interacting protein 5 isoform X3 n=1 Tax=Symphalangus syndactylus TaxID=9590 RepID=UPI0024412903|nr:rab11 family-interacting protein 5 isoform X3 [Symphalangus syndactylus]
MALVRGAEPAAGPSRWLPTHVQVTVLRARGLRGKSSGAGSTSDAYTVIQVGREKYSTSVVEKTHGCPEWREECSFELPPGALDGLLRAQEADAGSAPWAASSAAACELVLTTMHRSLIGVDKFLGQATVALDEVFGAGRAQHTQWYKLHSKPGKKEKERGEIEVTIQFTRNNLSASMFDLSMKDKPRSPFSKIKDKMKGKKKYDLESASAILPSSAIEDPDLGSLGKMGKAKGFFLRNKLRKSSLTQSNTSLGSDSTLSSASGSLAYQGPGAELLTRSPSRSSWLSTEGGRDSAQSPKLFTHKRTHSDEANQMRVAPPRALLDLQGHLDAASRSSLCVNGSHIYNEEPQGPLRHRSSISGSLPSSGSLQAVSSRFSEEGPRSTDDTWPRGSRSNSSSEAVLGQEEPSAQAKVLAPGASHPGEEEGARLPEGKPVQVATPIVASSEAVAEKEGARKEERKPRMGLFHHHHQGLSRSELGRRSSLGASPHHSSSGEEKAKSSWFGLREAKDPTQKPSSPEVISVWERLPGPESAAEGQDDESSRGENQLCPDVETADDAWPWDVVTISPAAETASLVLRGESDKPPPQLQPESPETVSPKGSEGLPPLEPEPKPEWVSDKGLQPSTPPPKPPRLFTPSRPQEEEEKAAVGLSNRGPETEGEDAFPSALVVGPPETKEEGEKRESEESDSCSSATLLGQPGLEELVEDASAPVSGPCLSAPTSCPEGAAPTPCHSKSLALQSQHISGAPEIGEGPEAPEAQGQDPVGEGLGSLSVTSQQADVWVSKEDALNPFLFQGSRDPPSLSSASPPGSRESSIHSGPEELPTPPEPDFPPPPLPPWASQHCGGPSPPCSPLSEAWPLTTSSTPPGEPALLPGPLEPSPPGGSPALLREDLAAATPASPLVLLPLETRPAEEPQPSASPHPVKPLSAAPVEGSPDRKQSRSSLSIALSSGLEKLKTVTSGSIQPVTQAPQAGQMVDTKRLKDSAVLDQSAKYYHLTHDELISLLLQRERELSQRDEHVQELESYIDRLLVRIMETSPTLLQIPPGPPK